MLSDVLGLIRVVCITHRNRCEVDDLFSLCAEKVWIASLKWEQGHLSWANYAAYVSTLTCRDHNRATGRKRRIMPTRSISGITYDDGDGVEHFSCEDHGHRDFENREIVSKVMNLATPKQRKMLAHILMGGVLSSYGKSKVSGHSALHYFKKKNAKKLNALRCE
jgi:DNA-directed RNA polymerase specialized sigma24 family protein